MNMQWHGPHFSIVRDFREELRVGSVRPEPIEMVGDEPDGYVAAGTGHRPIKFRLFRDAQRYIEGPDNRAAVPPEVWSKELFG